jgi:hypothetical protein
VSAIDVDKEMHPCQGLIIDVRRRVEAGVVDRAADAAPAQAEPRFKRFKASAAMREIQWFVVVVLRVRNNISNKTP